MIEPVQNTPVIAAVSDHLLTGMLPNGRSRVLDSLLDPGTDYMQLLDVKIYQLHDRERPLSEQPDAIIEKSKLSLLMLPEDETRTQKFQRLGHGAQKRSVQACVLMPGFMVEGDIHLGIRACDSLSALRQGLNDYFPVTDALIVNCDVNITAQLVIVNRSFVTCLCTRSGDEVEASSEELFEADSENQQLSSILDAVTEMTDETHADIHARATAQPINHSRPTSDVVHRSIHVGPIETT